MHERNNWVSLLKRLGHHAESAIDIVGQRARQRFGFDAPLQIIAYCGYGNNFTSTLQGRVLEQSTQVTPEVDSLWHNLQQSYRRFETDEVPQVAVQAVFNDQVLHTVTDEEGYFLFEFDTPHDLTSQTIAVTLSLPEHPNESIETPAEVIIPSDRAKFGVISDIDDTILLTNATSIIEMMRLTFLQSSRTRVALPGVAAFYKALHAQVNPFFYVSSSPWNLYEFLTDFMQINEINNGPLFLRDYGIDNEKFIVNSHGSHKSAQIKKILTQYPDMPFILVGDSGQHDPEIYSSICEDHPEQILSCYIRDVSGDFRDQQVQQVINNLDKLNIDMLLVPNTHAAATHAAQKGYIDSESLPELASCVDNDILQDNNPVPQ